MHLSTGEHCCTQKAGSQWIGNLTATVSFSDADSSQSLSGTYAWHVIDALTGIDSEVQTGSIATLNGGTYFNRDDEVYVIVTPNDGISDGAPVDDSTLSSNTTDYLENNLKNTVKLIENKSEIELLAIGIGHDVTRYYKNAIKITDIQDLGDVMINQLSELFTEKKSKVLH